MMSQIDKIKEEFENFWWTPKYLDGTKPTPSEIADWWLSKIKELISQHNELLIKKIEEMPSSYVFNEEQKAMYFMTAKGIKEDIITLIKNSK